MVKHKPPPTDRPPPPVTADIQPDLQPRVEPLAAPLLPQVVPPELPAPELASLIVEAREELRRLREITERLAVPDERVADLIAELRQEMHSAIRMEMRRALPGLPHPISREVPGVIRVRTRDGRKRHPRAALTFGPDWTKLRTDTLSASQLDAITDDPVLEFDEDE